MGSNNATTTSAETRLKEQQPLLQVDHLTSYEAEHSNSTNDNSRTSTSVKNQQSAKSKSKLQSMANRHKVLKEVLSLLYWTMLAACTVGPGTVVTCARAGAEFRLNLIWALIFASILAYTLQEGTARLTINSGKSLGQCLQVKYKHGRLVWRVGIICWVVAVSVFLGLSL